MLQIFVFSFLAFIIGLTQSAGIGGGPILNIALMVGFELPAKNAMTITYLLLMGGSIAAISINYRKKNDNGYPIMDYNLILMTLPMITSGSLYGSMLHHFLSELVITICFVILISYLMYTCAKKYNQIVPIPSQQNTDNQLLQRKPTILFDEKAQNIHPTLLNILENQKNPFQKQKFKIALYILLYTISILLLRGGRNYLSIIGITYCGIGFWICNFLHLSLSYLFSKSVAIQKFKSQYEKQKLGYKFNEEQKINENKMRNCMFYGFITGVASACLGLGGSMILVPIWLNSGVDKNVATASAGPLIFLSAFSAFTLAFLNHSYDIKTIASYLILSFLSSFIIKRIVNFLIEKYDIKRMIYIILLLVMLICISMLLPFQVYRYRLDPQKFLVFGDFC